MADLSALFNTAEASLTKYNNDQTAVINDQAKITAAQAQLTSDQETGQTDGLQARIDAQAVVDAFSALLATLPTPPAPVVPPAA